MLLTQAEAAEALGTGVDFIRSLVDSGAVGFVPVGNDERVRSRSSTAGGALR